MGKLLVGWSEVSIAPENKRISLAGQFAERISEYVETPITVTTLAVESDGDMIIMCSCDLEGISEVLVSDVCKIVSKKCTDVDVDKIILTATHTHTEKLTGIVANICCPSQIVQHRHFISSDYWGKVKILLREEYGEDLFVLGLGGPGGDQCPIDLIRWVNGETPLNDPNISRPD